MAIFDGRVILGIVALAVGACRAVSRESEPTPSPSPAAPAATPTAGAGGGFVARRDVDAVDQPDSSHVVGHLSAGTRYALQKRGGPGGVWCKVDLEKGAGWVLCAEGEAASPSPSPARASASTPPLPAVSPQALGSGFAYYVLTLSWSPSFCTTPAGARSQEQCGAGRRYGFVVHGLWPQNERGWPDGCTAVGDGPSPALVTRMLDIMPSRSLVQHEWEHHGTCSGLSADDYFARLRAAWQSIRIPEAYVAPKDAQTASLDEVMRAFLASNPRLTTSAITVHCKSQLDEVRLCLEKDLTPRACGADVRSACKGTFTVPPLR